MENNKCDSKGCEDFPVTYCPECEKFFYARTPTDMVQIIIKPTKVVKD